MQVLDISNENDKTKRDSESKIEKSLDSKTEKRIQNLNENNLEEITIKDKRNIFEKFKDSEEGLHYKDFIKEEQKFETNKTIGMFSFLKKLKFKFKSLAFYLNDNYSFLIVITCFTFYVLFADYFRIMLFTKQADIYFDIMVIICMAFFTLEFLVVMISEKGYFLSYYFFLDVITILFLIFDISLLSNGVFYSHQNFNIISTIVIEVSKIVRIIRLVRIFKLIKTLEIQKLKKKKKISNSTGNFQKDSKITKKLKDLNMKRLIFLIMIMIFLVPFFDVELWFSNNYLILDHKIAFILPGIIEKPSDTDLSIKNLQQRFVDMDLKLLDVEILGVYRYTNPEIDKTRDSELLTIIKTLNYKNKDYISTLKYSQKYQKIIQAVLDLINTIFICLILVISINNLNKNFSKLILNPLERMIKKIINVAENPLNAFKSRNTENNEEMNEALVIEKAINKISELLILGFGQAGCTIITHFLFDPDKDFDQIIPGKKICAIFGFCDIRNFTDATEVLLEDIMLFVNQIASIVHNSVDHFGGAANKNIGDAFLLVWKLFEPVSQVTKEENDDDFSEMKKNPLNKQLAELSLLCFIDIVIQINTVSSILKYQQNERLCRRMPGYKVKMGFGLHVGWAIEGAIGSRFKIDASYLSPNVNMSSRLEAATKQFDKLILFTGDLYDMFLTPNLIKISRHIDTIMVKGSNHPVRLYTVDLNLGDLIIEKSPNLNEKRISIPFEIKSLGIKKTFTNKFKSLEEEKNVFEKRNFLKMKTEEDDEMVMKKIKETNFQLIFDLNNDTNKDFKIVFNFGLDSYLNGKWDISKRFLEKALKIIPDDGPTLVIYDYIKSLDFKVPVDWLHCRQLLEK